MDDRKRPAPGLELLRDGDPALEQPPLSELEHAQMRQRILAEARTPVGPPPRIALRIALPMSVAGVLAAVWLVVWSTIPGAPGTTPDPAGPTVPPTAAGTGGDADLPNRHLQFITPGGTRIVWDLRRDFRMPAVGDRTPLDPEPRS